MYQSHAKEDMKSSIYKIKEWIRTKNILNLAPPNKIISRIQLYCDKLVKKLSNGKWEWQS